jgi:hypothetical protein
MLRRKKISNSSGRRENGACQNDWYIVTGQQAFLAGHCPLTVRYFRALQMTDIGSMIYFTL